LFGGGGAAGVQHHTDAERALIESFREAGGERVIFVRRGQPRLPREEAEALARLVRDGRIRRHATGDFGWMSYRLHEWAGPPAPGEAADAEPAAAPDRPAPGAP
jgi:hypothetical protein